MGCANSACACSQVSTGAVVNTFPFRNTSAFIPSSSSGGESQSPPQNSFSDENCSISPLDHAFSLISTADPLLRSAGIVSAQDSLYGDGLVQTPVFTVQIPPIGDFTCKISQESLESPISATQVETQVEGAAAQVNSTAKNKSSRGNAPVTNSSEIREQATATNKKVSFNPTLTTICYKPTIFRPSDLEYFEVLGHKRLSSSSGGVKNSSSSAGSSEVVRAKVRNSSLECAVKTIIPSPRVNLSQVKRELDRLHGCLERHKDISPLIVDFYGAFVLNGRMKLVMELMDGSLAQIIERQLRIPEEVLASIIKLLLLGVKYLHHQLHLIHRDIKPSNIFFNKEGGIKISDFGTSATIETSIVEQPCFMGTLLYMSPERLQGEPYTFNADVWSMGLIALELAQGFLPFHDLTSSAAEGESSNSRGLQLGRLISYLFSKGSPRLSGEWSEAYSPEFKSFLRECFQMDSHSRAYAKDLLNHDWIANYTLSEESLDEARLSEWLTTVDFFKQAVLPSALTSTSTRKRSKYSVPSTEATKKPLQLPSTGTTQFPLEALPVCCCSKMVEDLWILQ